MKFESYLEKVLFDNYKFFLEALESRHYGSYLTLRNLKISPAGKIHLWALSSTYLLHVFYGNDFFKEFKKQEDSNTLKIILDKYFINVSNHIRTENIIELQNIKNSKIENSYVTNLLSEYYIKGNNFLLNQNYIGFSIFDTLYNNYSSELAKILTYFSGYSDEAIEDTIGCFIDNKYKPELTFITIFIHPYYYAIVENHNQIDILLKRTFNSHTNSHYNDFMIELFRICEASEYNFNRKITDKDILKQEIFNLINSHLKNNKSCYLATLAYEDINHPKVELYRNFRDNYLVKYKVGELFIKYYYIYSPYIVKKLQPYNLINKIIRFNLDFLLTILPQKNN